MALQGDRGSTERIPWVAREEYATRCGFDEEQIEDLHYYVPKMDAVWGKHVAKKRKQETDAETPRTQHR